MDNKKLQFVYIIRPIKEDFNETATDEENKIVHEHFLYLKKLLEEEVLVLAGPEPNAKFGLVIFETNSEKEAEEIMNNDPAVKNEVFKAELFPFRVSLLRGKP